MKSKILALVAAVLVTAALAVPIRLASQGQTTHFRHYKLIDMGTFGGPESYLVSPENSRPTLNSQGMTVGGSGTSVPTTSQSNPFVCGGIASFIPNLNHAFEWHKGVVTDLGALAPTGQNCSVATSINANGEIAGISENGVIDPVLGFNDLRAVLWKDGKILDLGTLGGSHSIVGQVNNMNQVSGEALNNVADPFSLFDFLIFGSPNGTQTRAFLWQNGVMQDLGTLGGPDAGAGFGFGFLNDRGQVTGISYTNSTPNPVTGFPTLDPFLWENGKMQDLGSLGGTVGFSSGLNNRGQVIGGSSLAVDPGACYVVATASLEFLGSPNCHPFLWDQGKLIDLNTSTTGGNPITVNAINDAGEIVGGAAFPNTSFDAYLWRNGVATDLGNLGDCASKAHNLNSQGQVVGATFLCDGSFSRAFLWENGSIVDLNDLIPAGSSLQLRWAMAINDHGEIAGLGVPLGCGDMDSCGHAFLLIPVCADGNEGCADAPLDPAVVQASAATLTQSTASLVDSPNLTAAEIMSRYRTAIARRSLLGRLISHILDRASTPQISGKKN